MQEIWIDYLNALDAKALALTNDEILDAVSKALDAQGRGETVIEPRVHLVPESSDKGHFNVLRGYVKALNYAGVKVVGDFVDNYKVDLPSELAVLNLFDPNTGVPKAIIDATAITDMRTGAVTALGAKYLARKNSKIPAISVPAEPRTGMSAFSIISSTSMKSACIRAARKVAMPSQSVLRRISARRSSLPTIGRIASRAPISWSRRAACRNRNRCSRRNG